jgi:hypothetical protein
MSSWLFLSMNWAYLDAITGRADEACRRGVRLEGRLRRLKMEIYAGRAYIVNEGRGPQPYDSALEPRGKSRADSSRSISLILFFLYSGCARQVRGI